MKKKEDFIIPFTWENRYPLIFQRTFILPDYFHFHDEYKFDFSSKSLFGNDNKIFMEYCSGNGQWILEKAKKHPDINWIAVEKDFKRVRKIWIKMHNLNLNNVFIVFAEAYAFTKFYLKENSVFSIFINFPDPWPKKKHEKNRLINPIFINELRRVLKKCGDFMLVTDDEFSSKKLIEICKDQRWISHFKKPYFSHEIEDYGDSYFKSLWLSKKRKIFYHKFLN